METLTQKSEAYKEILNQLGNNKFIVMTGVKNLGFSNEGNTLSMYLPKNASKAKYLSITLNSMDTYELTFTTVTRDFQFKEIVKFTNIYADQLQTTFTKITGLYTSL